MKAIILCFLVVILLYVSISKFYLKKDIIKLFDYSCLIVVTGSMEPTIHIKELIVIQEKENYEINDIVTYRDNKNNFVTHRIIEKKGNIVITRGDNNTKSDIPIELENIEGKVIYHSVVLGELFLSWLKPIIIIFILFCMINFVKNTIFNREVKIDEEKKI